MPAFTFEKIPAPATAIVATPQPSPRKPSTGQSRALIYSMLDRLALARLKRDRADLPPTLPRKPPPE